MGRKRALYTPNIASRIINHLIEGKSLEQALDKEPLGPTLDRFNRWLEEYPEFREKYERARRLQADLHADKMLEIAQKILNGDLDDPGSIRVAVDVLKWQAKVRNRTMYGEQGEGSKTEKPLDAQKLVKEIARLEKELGAKKTTKEIAPTPTPVLNVVKK